MAAAAVSAKSSSMQVEDSPLLESNDCSSLFATSAGIVRTLASAFSAHNRTIQFTQNYGLDKANQQKLGKGAVISILSPLFKSGTSQDEIYGLFLAARIRILHSSQSTSSTLSCITLSWMSKPSIQPVDAQTDYPSASYSVALQDATDIVSSWLRKA